MVKEFDYHNFDKLEVTAKTVKEREIISHYALFGWQEVKRVEDKKFFDISHITFIRPHKIANKDKLQLLQIYYENYMNELYACEKSRHTVSVAYVICSILSGLILSTISVITFFAKPFLLKVLAVLIMTVGAFLTSCSFIKHRNIRKCERENFQKRYADLKFKIDCVLNDATILAGGENA